MVWAHRDEHASRITPGNLRAGNGQIHQTSLKRRNNQEKNWLGRKDSKSHPEILSLIVSRRYSRLPIQLLETARTGNKRKFSEVKQDISEVFWKSEVSHSRRPLRMQEFFPKSFPGKPLLR